MSDQHDTLDTQALERAALQGLGALEAKEARDYEAHLDECLACESEVATFGPVVDDLALAAPPIEPPSHLLGEVLRRIHASPQQQREPSPAAAPLSFTMSDDGAWESFGVDGVEFRTLFIDEERKRVTLLVRIESGVSYPAHRHRDAEECYVLQGDLKVGDVVMHAGDYQFAPARSLHPVQSTEKGCLLLINTGVDNEIAA